MAATEVRRPRHEVAVDGGSIKIALPSMSIATVTLQVA